MNRAEAAEILSNPKNVRFVDLIKVATAFFGEPRVRGSHHIFKTQWPGEPFVNLQADGKMAKEYQVKQVIKAMAKLEEVRR